MHGDAADPLAADPLAADPLADDLALARVDLRADIEPHCLSATDTASASHRSSGPISARKETVTGRIDLAAAVACGFFAYDRKEQGLQAPVHLHTPCAFSRIVLSLASGDHESDRGG